MHASHKALLVSALLRRGARGCPADHAAFRSDPGVASCVDDPLWVRMCGAGHNSDTARSRSTIGAPTFGARRGECRARGTDLATYCSAEGGNGAWGLDGMRFSAGAGPPPVDELSVTSAPPPPALSEYQPAWTDPRWASPLSVKRRIFCNRSLNMDSVIAVGFDMDYTLAQYRSETFETLAHSRTVEKLVAAFGYPPEIREFKFDWRYMMRGLIIDKKRGNVVKVDRHKYVKIAYHGFRALNREERVSAYSRSEVRESFDEPDYAMIDTLFSLAEAHLFMNLVVLKDAHSEALSGKDYAQIYRDVRQAVDLCHRDGSLKRAVAADPAKYIHSDDCLVDVLNTLRLNGKKTFLATNSLWDYTNVVMNFLLSNRKGSEKNLDWLQYFDAVMTGCAKPAFFSASKPLFVVDPHTGMLGNTDNGAPIIPIGEDDLPSLRMSSTAPHLGNDGQKAKTFQGGTYVDLHKMLGVDSGSDVLYVGDHIYGDILRSKKSLGWRTMLVVPELEAELDILSRHSGIQDELQSLRDQRDALEDQIHRLEWSVRHRSPASSGDDSQSAKVAKMLEELVRQREDIRLKHKSLLRDHHRAFHPVWGRLLKTGYVNSRLAHQIERFACLYTSHIANLTFYSPRKNYRGRVDRMAHEEDLCLGLIDEDDIVQGCGIFEDSMLRESDQGGAGNR
eukprot:evm.model.scf_402.8 EVM.evm.TU.scf_402.8   scf_402:69587-73325(-)